MKLLSGTEAAAPLLDRISQTLRARAITPGLAVVLVGDHPSSLSYIAQKERAAARVGISVFLHRLPSTSSAQEVASTLLQLNHDERVDGILIQLPLPPPLSATALLQLISPDKDVDGFHPLNLGKLLMGLDDGFVPCTPKGIKYLLDFYSLPVEGKSVVIIGRSTVVGRPLAALLMRNTPGYNATVTVAHSHTPNLATFTQQADIVVAAVGKPGFLRAEMVKAGAVVVDVGITREGGHLVGDVEPSVQQKASAYTPVPGGVGPMTVAMLLHNTLLSYQRRHGLPLD